MFLHYDSILWFSHLRSLLGTNGTRLVLQRNSSNWEQNNDTLRACPSLPSVPLDPTVPWSTTDHSQTPIATSPLSLYTWWTVEDSTRVRQERWLGKKGDRRGDREKGREGERHNVWLMGIAGWLVGHEWIRLGSRRGEDEEREREEGKTCDCGIFTYCVVPYWERERNVSLKTLEWKHWYASSETHKLFLSLSLIILLYKA